ncbi:MAG: RNA methyltransferase [Lachnospiraceae bacterium]|nr:RNA methyltransferase [Lachnospiraceae bacterium]
MQYSQRLIRIDSVDEPELSVFQQRSEVQLLRYNEPDPGIFICESSKVIKRALDAGYEPMSFLVSEQAVEETNAMLGDISETVKEIPVFFGSDDILKDISGYSLTGGMLCAMKRKRLKTIEEITAGRRRIAVLENVQNPTNVGSVFRSAAALGVEAVLLTYDSSDPLYRRAARVSMGTVFQIPWTIIDKNADYLRILSDNGFSAVAMALSDNSVSIDDPRIKAEEKIAVILGNEGYGLCGDTIKRSDYVAKIPMNPVVDSLNVGAASAVMFWELMH